MNDNELRLFRETLYKWDDLSKREKEQAKILKEIKDEKKVLQQQNIDQMLKYEFDVCSLDDGKISLRKTKRESVDIKKGNFQQLLKEYYNNVENLDDQFAQKKVDNIMEYLKEHHTKVSESISLTRTYTR